MKRILLFLSTQRKFIQLVFIAVCTALLLCYSCSWKSKNTAPDYVTQQINADTSPKQEIMAYPTNGPFGTGVRAIIQIGTILITGTDKGIFNSKDGGITWSEDNEGLREKNVLALAQAGDGVYAGTEDGIYMKRGLESSWLPVKTGDKKLPKIYSLAYNNGLNLFAGTSDGIYRIRLASDSLDTEWELETSVPKDLSVRDLHVINSVVYASTDNGLYRLDDGSKLWIKETIGVGDISVNNITSSPHEIFVSTSSGLYRKGSGETLWQLVQGDPARNSIYAAVMDGTLFNETPDGLFCKDLKAEATTVWVQCDEGLGNQVIQTFSGLPIGVFVGTQGGIFKWNQGTRTWTESNNNLSRAQTTKVVSTAGPQGAVIFAITTQYDQSDPDSAIYRSDDLGKSWTLISTKLGFGWTDSLEVRNNRLYTTKAGNVYIG